MRAKHVLLTILLGFLLATGLLLIGYSPKQAVVSITFDDGLASQYDSAALLEEYGWRGTFYIPSDFVGKEFEGLQVMTAEQILALHDKGHEIGSHTANHILAKNVSAEEYELSLLAGEEVAGIITFNFAYPYGDNSKKEIAEKYFETTRLTRPCINDFADVELCGLTLVSQNSQYESLESYLGKLQKTGGWLVIVIHGVSEEPRPDIDLTPEEFSWVLEQIESADVSVKTISEVKNDAN